MWLPSSDNKKTSFLLTGGRLVKGGQLVLALHQAGRLTCSTLFVGIITIGLSVPSKCSKNLKTWSFELQSCVLTHSRKTDRKDLVFHVMFSLSAMFIEMVPKLFFQLF